MSSDMLKLYESSGSPNSRRVRIFLAEKGICVSRVPVDLGAKEQFSDAYVRINPRRVVPRWSSKTAPRSAKCPRSCAIWRKRIPTRRCSARRPERRRW